MKCFLSLARKAYRTLSEGDEAWSFHFLFNSRVFLGPVTVVWVGILELVLFCTYFFL